MNRLPISGHRPVPPMHAFGVDPHEADLTSGTPHMQVCTTCAQTHFPPPCACDCGSILFRSEILPTTGLLYAATTIHAAPGALAELAPYVVGLIDLQGGPRLLLRVLGPKGWQPECDGAVRLIILDYDDGSVLAAHPEGINIAEIGPTGQSA